MSTSRLDAELVRRGLARARGQADEMVRGGRVTVDGRPATKPALRVDPTSAIDVVASGEPDWVGRGARKLDGFLDDLAEAGPVVRGRRCLDAGASTGGFTQVLLDRGAREVVAVDVGHDQLAEVLRHDERVDDRPGTSVRGLTPHDVGGPADLLVADLSFISLQAVLADLARLVEPGGDLVLLVKPQFEVGRARLRSGGVVRDPALRMTAVQAVAETALGLGAAVRAVRASRWPGPSGNVEYFLWLTLASERTAESEQTLPSALSVAGGTVDPSGRTAAVSPEALAAVVRAAVEEGPS